MSEILGNTHNDSVVVVALVKYILSHFCSHCIRNCTFGTFWRLWEVGFWRRKIQNILMVLLVFFFVQKAVELVLENFHDLRFVSCRKLPNSLLNNILKNLLIGLQYIFSFKWPDYHKRSATKIQGFFMRIGSHLLKKSLIEKYFLCNVSTEIVIAIHRW